MNGVRLSRQYLKFMIEKNEGRVIFIASEAAIMPSQEMAHYSATKTMQLSLSRSLAELTKGTKVTVNTVMPGSTLTEGVETMLHTLYPGEKLTIEEAETRFRRLFKQSVIIGNKWLSLADRRGIGANRILKPTKKATRYVFNVLRGFKRLWKDITGSTVDFIPFRPSECNIGSFGNITQALCIRCTHDRLHLGRMSENPSDGNRCIGYIFFSC